MRACWLLLLPLSLWGQTAVEMCALQGKVSNGVSGQPLAKAVVMLFHADPPGPGMPAANYTTASDAGGQFAMAGVECGHYRMQVSRVGFVTMSYGGGAGAVFSLTKAQPPKDLAFPLMPQAVVTGRVLDEDGEHVPNARVQLMASRFAQGKRQIGAGGFGQTNDLGEYRIFSLPPGLYSLSASPMISGPVTVDRSATPQSEGQYVSADYPKPIVVAAGQTVRGIDVKISRMRTFHVRGRITSSVAGRHGYTLFLMGGSGAGRSSSRLMIDPKGDFDIPNVLPGRYTLQAGFAVDVSYYATNLTIEVKDKDVEGLTLNVGKPIAVTGHVTAEAGVSLAALLVHAQLQGADSMAVLSADSKIAADGSFKFAEVSPGKYMVTVENLPENAYLKSGDVLEVGTTAPVVQIAIGMGAGTVSGKTSAGATVALLKGAMYKVATADANGTFTIRGVPPGTYQAYAWTSAEKAGYLDAEYMKTVDGKGVVVAIAGSEEKKVSLAVVE